MHVQMPRTLLCLCALAMLVAAGCVSDEQIANDLVFETSQSEASAPLGGEGLSQRRLELDRAYRDLESFHATLSSLNRRGDRSGTVQFREFLMVYLVKHVYPLLRGEWQSRHPELSALDANVRFAVAEIWLQMRSVGAADQMIEEIERRYAGREEMLVAYPLGSSGTLGEGLQKLRDGGTDWRS